MVFEVFLFFATDFEPISFHISQKITIFAFANKESKV